MIYSNDRYQNAGSDPKRAFDELTKAIEIDPKYVAAYMRRAEVEKRLGRPKDAAEDYRRAVKISPSDRDAASGLEMLLQKNPELEETLTQTMEKLLGEHVGQDK
jgi:Tfp pilus assembly protein PilF